jgi:hypothetical protein
MFANVQARVEHGDDQDHVDLVTTPGVEPSAQDMGSATSALKAWQSRLRSSHPAFSTLSGNKKQTLYMFTAS